MNRNNKNINLMQTNVEKYNLKNIFLSSKERLEGILIGTLLSGVIFGGIGVVAITLQAEQIKYVPSNENFKATNIKEAMDEIYTLTEYEVPENTYFYEKGTEGDSNIVRYKKINDEYFICNQYGKVDEDAIKVDVSNKTLIPYHASSSSNLTAGSAGYSSNSLILGDGSDNKNHFEEGDYKKVVKIGNINSSGSFTINVKSLLPLEYSSLTTSSFFVKNPKINFSGREVGSYAGKGYSTSLSTTFSYNSSTGVLTVNPINLGVQLSDVYLSITTVSEIYCEV